MDSDTSLGIPPAANSGQPHSYKQHRAKPDLDPSRYFGTGDYSSLLWVRMVSRLCNLVTHADADGTQSSSAPWPGFLWDASTPSYKAQWCTGTFPPPGRSVVRGPSQ